MLPCTLLQKEPPIFLMLMWYIVTEKPILDTECVCLGCNCYISKYGVHCLVWTHVGSTDLCRLLNSNKKGKVSNTISIRPPCSLGFWFLPWQPPHGLNITQILHWINCLPTHGPKTRCKVLITTTTWTQYYSNTPLN
jgi:hypothetical protein